MLQYFDCFWGIYFSWFSFAKKNIIDHWSLPIFKRIKIFNRFFLHFIVILQSVTKIMGKAATWTISCFSSIPPLNNVEKQWAKLASSYVMGSQHCIGGEGGFLNRLFKIPIILSLIVWNLAKNLKDEVLLMLFQISQNCFNEPCYVMLHYVMNIMTENNTKMTHKRQQY